jgi:hypothetical protein
MDERRRRIARNEAVFREVNERIAELASEFGLGDRRLELVCECGDASCAKQIEMTAAEYEAIRSDAVLFALYPDHENPKVDEVVEKHDAYHVVRKREGVPAKVAEATDPRK